MKVKKYELVRIIDKLKSVVQKNTVHPALGGVLVKEGYLIAANGEITIASKLLLIFYGIKTQVFFRLSKKLRNCMKKPVMS